MLDRSTTAVTVRIELFYRQSKGKPTLIQENGNEVRDWASILKAEPPKSGYYEVAANCAGKVGISCSLDRR